MTWLLPAAALAAGALILAAAWALCRLLRLAPLAAAYKAKVLASAVFVSGREPEAALEDVSADSYWPLKLFRAEVDRENAVVRVSLFGRGTRTAFLRPGLGCTLAPAGVSAGAVPPPQTMGGGLAPAGVSAGAVPPPQTMGGGLAPAGANEPWPFGEGGPASPAELEDAGVDPVRLAAAVDAAFDEPDPRKPRRTRAVAVVLRGRLVAERYAPGFSRATPLAGWSMTKCVTAALAGVLAGEGRLEVGRKALLPEWGSPGDPRARISLDDLLRMQSGLEFSEDYAAPRSDVNRMLFLEPDAAGYAASKRPAGPPGSVWRYSSGATNIVSRVMRSCFATDAEYLSFPGRALFGPLGMASAVLETDASGTFVGSSFMYATARDWARFGLLHAQDGTWRGRRVLPEGWVSFLTKPAAASKGRYGAHWWLRLSPEFGGETPAAGRLPPDAFFAMGHEGQALAVIPSTGLVAVRLGLSVIPDAWDEASFLAGLLEAVPA